MSAVEVRTFSVYLHTRGKRPVKVAELPEQRVADATFDHAGVTYYNCTVDLTRRTVTFADYRPEPVKVPA